MFRDVSESKILIYSKREGSHWYNIYSVAWQQDQHLCQKNYVQWHEWVLEKVRFSKDRRPLRNINPQKTCREFSRAAYLPSTTKNCVKPEGAVFKVKGGIKKIKTTFAQHHLDNRHVIIFSSQKVRKVKNTTSFIHHTKTRLASCKTWNVPIQLLRHRGHHGFEQRAWEVGYLMKPVAQTTLARVKERGLTEQS